MRRGDGFTLIELMVVVAIIALIVAIAVPSLQNARKAATETVVIGTLRSIVTVNEQYRRRYGTYANPLDDLVPLLPQIGSTGNQSLEEYDTDYQVSGSVWTLQVWPVNPGVTADRSFWVDVSGVIRVEQTGLATSTSPSLDS